MGEAIPGLVLLESRLRKTWEAACKQYSSVAFAPAPASRLQSCVSSYPGSLQWCIMIWNHQSDKEHFPPLTPQKRKKKKNRRKRNSWFPSVKNKQINRHLQNKIMISSVVGTGWYGSRWHRPALITQEWRMLIKAVHTRGPDSHL